MLLMFDLQLEKVNLDGVLDFFGLLTSFGGYVIAVCASEALP